MSKKIEYFLTFRLQDENLIVLSMFLKSQKQALRWGRRLEKKATSKRKGIRLKFAGVSS